MKKLHALVLALAFTVWPLVAMAQGGPDAEDAATSRSATFQAMEGPTTEDVAGGPLLVAAYAAINVLLLGYVVWLGALQSGTTRDLARLRKVIERAESAPKVG